MSRRLLASLALACAAGLAQPAAAAEDGGGVLLTVTAALMELHTGPGRGYPVFHVIETGETVTVLKRRTRWFKVRSATGKEGWVSREQIEATLKDERVAKNLRDAVLEDFDHQRLDAGFAAGYFDGDPVVSFRVGYHFADSLVAELGLAQVSGTYSGSQLYTGALLLEHRIAERYVPYFGLSGGRFENRSRASLVGTTDTQSGFALGVGAGLRVYLTRNFLLRLDYRQLQVLTNERHNDHFDEALVGFSFFF